MSLAGQSAETGSFSVVIVDNASIPEVTSADCAILTEAGIASTIVRESKLGNVFSRARAYQETNCQWILFVDDDNELDPDYIKIGLEIIRNRPEIGCFGGKLELPAGINVPRWVIPLLPFLAIRDFGDKEITNIADYWGQWEPATAGGFIRREILGAYARRILDDPSTHVLGRKGRKGLNSCEDSLMMAGAFHLGLACSYQPSLKLYHHVRADRFRLSYLLPLMYGFGRSEVMLDFLCGRTAHWSVQSNMSALREIMASSRRELTESLQYAFCMMVRRIGLYRQRTRLMKDTKNDSL